MYPFLRRRSGEGALSIAVTFCFFLFFRLSHYRERCLLPVLLFFFSFFSFVQLLFLGSETLAMCSAIECTPVARYSTTEKEKKKEGCFFKLYPTESPQKVKRGCLAQQQTLKGKHSGTFSNDAGAQEHAHSDPLRNSRICAGAARASGQDGDPCPHTDASPYTLHIKFSVSVPVVYGTLQPSDCYDVTEKRGAQIRGCFSFCWCRSGYCFSVC